MALRIIFAGSSAFAIPSLQALAASEHEICAVYTVLDKRAGRGMKLSPTPVKEGAIALGLAVYQPESLKTEDVQRILADFHADIMVDVAYGLIIPPEVLAMFQFGCINVHPSLLPRWRGAAPIQQAILAGDKVTGVTIMQVDEGLDTGAILRQIEVPIADDDNAAILHEKLATIGAQLLLATLDDIVNDKIVAVPQNNNNSCYAHKLQKEQGKINWNLTCAEIDRMIKAYNPWPVAFTMVNDNLLKIWQAIPIPQKTLAAIGTIVKVDRDGVDVVCGDGVMRLLELQISGGKILKVADILGARWGWLRPGVIING